MSHPLPVVLLWHMHQPYYVDPLTGQALMPWVRLHAARGYTDMIAMARRHPEARMTFNFTPVLVRQLLELAEGRVTDPWLEWSRLAPADLDAAGRRGVIEHFFKIHWGNLIEPFPRYRELLELRGRSAHHRALDEAARLFTERDLRDLQVWFNLNWCGFELTRAHPELEEMRRKGRDFTEEEKQRVLDLQMEAVAGVLGRYREARDAGAIELTTTPYFHPIMPLVYDTDIAARAMPGRQLPPRFQAPEDVSAQLRMAQEQHERVFGARARGMWPSEGSVCPEILPLMAEQGIEYFCTDEDVLFRSLEVDTEWKRPVDHLELFQPWTCAHGDARMHALFRERPLSDYIGFHASRTRAEDSSGHLIHHLEHLSEVVKNPNGVVCLVLDGENAWEAFPDGGESFLDLFYRRLTGSKKVAPIRLGDAFEGVVAAPVVRRLHSGSWIQANFDIWIGDPEENKGWEWIGRTREFLVKHLEENKVEEETARRAWEEIYAAEGSDWFWWYGPDFQTDCDMIFDLLFRRHLQNVHRLLGVEPPLYLDVPIRQRGGADIFRAPGAYISPNITGKGSGFYDWLGAGHYEASRAQGAMFQGDLRVRDIFFGFDRELFYFRLDFKTRPEKVVVQFCRPAEEKVVMIPGAGGVTVMGPEGVKAVCGGNLEMSMPLAALGLSGDGERGAEGKMIAFVVRIFVDETELERYPAQGLMEFAGPQEQFELRNWFV